MPIDVASEHIVRALILTLLLAGCDSEPTKQAAPAVVEAPQRAPKDVLAETILAAITADDFDRLRPMFESKTVPTSETTQLADLGADSVKTLRRKLRDLKIDLATAKLVRVESSGRGLEMFDVFIEANGRIYKTHFSAMAGPGGYQLVGLANWIVPADQ